jgi:hypothetical protein
MAFLLIPHRLHHLNLLCLESGFEVGLVAVILHLIKPWLDLPIQLELFDGCKFRFEVTLLDHKLLLRHLSEV